MKNQKKTNCCYYCDDETDEKGSDEVELVYNKYVKNTDKIYETFNKETIYPDYLNIGECCYEDEEFEDDLDD